MNMVKWIEINCSGAFYRLPAPVKSAQHEWSVFRQWGMAYSSSVAAPFFYMAQPLSQSCTWNPWHSPAIEDAGKTFH